MPEKHINQWKHNRSFLETIRPQFPDWAVTVTFYTALHAVDALLRHDKTGRITSHSHRNETLMRTNRYARIWKLYQPLHDLSRTIRYMAQPEKWVSWDVIESEIFRRYLYPLEVSVLKLTGFQEDLPKIRLLRRTDR
jgi:hypothetical protein